ncbi:DUF3048 domain-containing protein [Chungangia koreensis]|uniref:DUF3048 domain-containing protein n=2 Tax=Chungangia koreensis TaxID=752657 RepID=A0ABV8X4I0_9LACT
MLLFLSACKDKEEVVVSADTPEPKEEQSEEIEEEIKESLPYKAPFTGVGSEVENDRRPVLVTINNHPHARPQSGISDADIVYELLAEGSVTRLLALFQSELPEEIGPVRSSRDYFIDIAKGLDAFYVAHGYSPEAKAMLQNGVVDHINGMQYDGILFWRSKDRVAPHNSYISGENIVAGMEKVKADPVMSQSPPFVFYDSAENVTIETIANTIDVRYGSNESFHHTYTYDPNTFTYSRQSGGETTIDRKTGEEVAVSNILFFETPHRTIDTVGRQEIELNGGKAYIFQAGAMREIEWANLDGVLTPIEGGQPAKLVPGRTWIHVIPTKPGLSQSVTFTP